MTEQLTNLPESETYTELAGEATSHDEIVALREMAASDLAKTAEISLSEGNGAPSETVDVTTLGSSELADIHAANNPKVQESMAVHSKDWTNEEK